MTVPKWENLQKRTLALEAVRRFFNGRDYLEIETRFMRPTTATDPYIESFKTFRCDGEKPYYFQTSPEYSHKIFLASHRKPIYEIARVFRNEPSGHLHRPEFTLIEWYHPECDYNDMMDETASLIRHVSHALGTTQWQSNARENSLPLNVELPFDRMTVSEAFLKFAGFSPIGLSKKTLLHEAKKCGCMVNDDWSWNDIMNCVLVDKVEPKLGMDRPTFLMDYPASMASLAQTRHTPNGDVAERFELYICGIELCNGYSELNDAVELKSRFDQDNYERSLLGLDPMPDDEALLKSLPSLGKLGGNALGFERLLMLCLGCDDISQVMIDV